MISQSRKPEVLDPLGSRRHGSSNQGVLLVVLREQRMAMSGSRKVWKQTSTYLLAYFDALGDVRICWLLLTRDDGGTAREDRRVLGRVLSL